jgi:chromosomal replication initiator protein
MSGNVRQLQGALTRVVAVASMRGEAIDTALAADALGRDPVAVRGTGEPSTDAIREAVSRRLDIDPAQLAGASRTPAAVRARHIAIYLCRELTSLSLPRIGAAFERDHSTVLHAIRKLERELPDDRELRGIVSDLRSQLGGSPQPPVADRPRCENRSLTHNPAPQQEPPLAPPIDSNQQTKPLSAT